MVMIRLVKATSAVLPPNKTSGMNEAGQRALRAVVMIILSFSDGHEKKTHDHGVVSITNINHRGMVMVVVALNGSTRQSLDSTNDNDFV
jgi:hypothetical protein